MQRHSHHFGSEAEGIFYACTSDHRSDNEETVRSKI